MTVEIQYTLKCTKKKCTSSVVSLNSLDDVYETGFNEGWTTCPKCGADFCQGHSELINEEHGNPPGEYYFSCNGGEKS